MLSCKVEIFEDNKWVEQKNCIYPVQTNDTLDTSLDNGQLTIKNVKREKVYPPLTKVRITDFDGETEEVSRYYINADYVEQSISGDNPRWTHNITLIEPSKELEGYIVDSCTVTQPLWVNYAKYVKKADGVILRSAAEEIGGGATDYIEWDINSPALLNTKIELKSFKEIYKLSKPYEIAVLNRVHIAWAVITSPSGKVINIPYELLEQHEKILLNEEGVYQIEYVATLKIGMSYTAAAFSYFIASVVDKENIAKKTISDVVNHILSITPTRLNGENQKFIYDWNTQTITDKIISPEFTFTKQTLWETLLEIGGYIHAIPRLITDGNDSENWNIITFDFLGGNEDWVKKVNSIYNTRQLGIDEYCSDIDSNLENIFNYNNINEGAVESPSYNIYKTPRTEDGNVEITNDNCYFSTDEPIGIVNKLTLRFIYGNQIHTIDATPYVYENSEYRVLSEYMQAFPYSKAYAIRYTQGQPNITGLQFKIQNPISPAFEKPSILNIINRETGVEIPATDIININYKIKYVPFINARVRQTKIDIFENYNKRTLVYNQTGNILDNTNYGENMKGAVLRMGNTDVTDSYITRKLENIPKVGNKIGNYYIAAVNKIRYRDYIRFTVEKTKYFNRLNKYIGINSSPRYYEISERQAQERDILYSEKVVIGQKVTNNDGYRISQPGAMSQFFEYITGSATNGPAYDIALCTTFDKDGTLLKTFALPINSAAYGNSLCFHFKFLDNYSVGSKATKTAITNNKKVQDFVNYCDSNGEFKYLCFSFVNVTERSILENNEDSLTKIGNDLPEINFDNFKQITSSISTMPYGMESKPSIENAIVINKGNRDIPSINIQLDVCRNDPNIIIGYYLLHNNRMVSRHNGKPVNIYLLPYKVGIFDKIVNLKDALFVKEVNSADFEVGMNERVLRSFDIMQDCESFVLADEDGNLFLAYNKSYKRGELSDNIYFSFTK